MTDQEKIAALTPAAEKGEGKRGDGDYTEFAKARGLVGKMKPVPDPKPKPAPAPKPCGEIE